MNRFHPLALVVVVFLYAATGVARADQAPAGATGRCKDGSYTESASKKGACKGHGGVAEWLATQGTASSEKASKKAKSDKSSTTSAAAQPSTPPEGATGKCKDGSYTTSATKKGACRGHGGVAEWTGGAAPSAPAKEAAPATAPATSKATSAAGTAATAPAASAKTSSNTDPTGATALCKDGTYSHSKHHTGACSHHGGVSQWLGQ